MKLVLKRVGAYLIDTIIVSMVASIFAGSTLINKDYKKYVEAYNEYSDATKEYFNFTYDLKEYYEDSELIQEEYEKLIDRYPKYTENLEEYYKDEVLDKDEYDLLNKNKDKIYKKDLIGYNYKLAKKNIVSSIIILIITILYFVVLQYYLDGETFGKKIFKLKVVSNDSSKVSMNKLLIRNLFLCGILISIIELICLSFMNSNIYYQASNILYFVSNLIQLLIICMCLARKDGRGLHDVIANTKVIDKNNIE